MSIRAAMACLLPLLTFCCLQPASAFAPSGARPESSGAVLGRIFELGKGSPIAGATVTARNQANGFEHTSITAEDGTFFIASLPPGLYVIRAICEGFRENSLSGYPVRLIAVAEPAQISLTRIGSGREPNTGNPPPPQTAVPQANSGESASSFEVRVQWDAYIGAGPVNAAALTQSTNADRFSLIGSRQLDGPIPRQRMPELSSTQILVVMTDEQGEPKGWTLIPDPRILRAESPGPNGELSGQILHRSSTEFLVPLSGGLLPASLKFYQPRWTGKDFSLSLLGTLAVR